MILLALWRWLSIRGIRDHALSTKNANPVSMRKISWIVYMLMYSVQWVRQLLTDIALG
jgi:hypothetical protein